MRISNILTAIGAAILLLAGGQSAVAQPTQSSSAPSSGPVVGEGASSAYVLGRDDVIEVSLVGGSGFSARTRVQADGTVQLPLIGKVPVADQTSSQLAEAIRTALIKGGFFADPIVSIEVVGYASRYVTVLGSVGTPSLVPINRPYRLSDILARVGGVRDGAADYIVVTSATGEEKRFAIRDLATGGAEKDPFVAAGDKIFSPTAETFYVYGQVNSPGAYALTTDMSVRQAIAKGGGLTESGSDKKVTVTRQGKKVKVDLDSKVLANDVLVLGERLF